MKQDELDNLFNEALDNIRNDRKLAREFLNEIANEISSDSEQNKYLSPVAAKHIETMQRSNEQLVKIITLRQKKSEESFALSEDDKSNLYDLIQGNESNG
jgi:DNA-binding protein H-NS|tara:strand:- start:499 stop:798 length:300 start_codon:yes stop_codon:yes gene_type:complete